MTDQNPDLDAAIIETAAHIRKSWNDVTAGIRRAWKAGMPTLAALAATQDDYALVPDPDADLLTELADAIREANATPEALAAWQRHPQLIPAHVYAKGVLPLLIKQRNRADAWTTQAERNGERWEQADAEMTAMRKRAEQAERERDAADRLAHTAEAVKDEARQRAADAIRRAEEAESEQRRLSAERDELAEGNAALDEAIGAVTRRALASEAAERRVRQVLSGKARLCGPAAVPMVPVDAVQAALDAETAP